MYKLIESDVHNGHLLHRIEATDTMCFGNFIIKPGTRGGWIESESNLGETAWVADEAMVYDDAIVTGNAPLFVTMPRSIVRGYSKVMDNACICQDAQVFGYAVIRNDAMISGNAKVINCAEVSDSARVCDHAIVSSSAKISDCAIVCGNAR